MFIAVHCVNVDSHYEARPTRQLRDHDKQKKNLSKTEKGKKEINRGNRVSLEKKRNYFAILNS